MKVNWLNLEDYSLEEVEKLYQNGYASEEAVIQYIREWNAGPHLTRAILWDGRIINSNIEEIEKWCKHHPEFNEKFNLRLT